MIASYHVLESEDCPEESKIFKAAQKILSKMYMDVLEQVQKDGTDGYKLTVEYNPKINLD